MARLALASSALSAQRHPDVASRLSSASPCVQALTARCSDRLAGALERRLARAIPHEPLNLESLLSFDGLGRFEGDAEDAELREHLRALHACPDLPPREAHALALSSLGGSSVFSSMLGLLDHLCRLDPSFDLDRPAISVEHAWSLLDAADLVSCCSPAPASAPVSPPSRRWAGA